MTTLQLRKKVHDQVDFADERLLKMVYAMMKEYSAAREYEHTDYFTTVEEKQEIYKRSKELKSGKAKGLSLKEVTGAARKRLKK